MLASYSNHAQHTIVKKTSPFGPEVNRNSSDMRRRALHIDHYANTSYTSVSAATQENYERMQNRSNRNMMAQRLERRGSLDSNASMTDDDASNNNTPTLERLGAN